jgi:hypothetical protein
MFDRHAESADLVRQVKPQPPRHAPGQRRQNDLVEAPEVERIGDRPVLRTTAYGLDQWQVGAVRLATSRTRVMDSIGVAPCVDCH